MSLRTPDARDAIVGSPEKWIAPTVICAIERFGGATWRGHSCLQRRDSSRRSGRRPMPRPKRVEMSLDPAGKSACATRIRSSKFRNIRSPESRPGRQQCLRHAHACATLMLLLAVIPLRAQTGENVLLVANRKSPLSRQIADYYRPLRSVPAANVCYLDSPTDERIDWATFQKSIELPVGQCLTKAGLQEKVLYIVLTAGIPLGIEGSSGTLEEAEQGSVDSELTLLYQKLKGSKFLRKGVVSNPFFGKRDAPFRHPQVPIYLVTRLAAYDWPDVKGMIDRSLAAHNRGRFVIDLRSAADDAGNDLAAATRPYCCRQRGSRWTKASRCSTTRRT